MASFDLNIEKMIRLTKMQTGEKVTSVNTVNDCIEFLNGEGDLLSFSHIGKDELVIVM